MPFPSIHTPDYWRQRAEETCAQASEMRDMDARRTMLQIAKMYAAMAVRAEFWEAETALSQH
jgi:hypothetical protein